MDRHPMSGSLRLDGRSALVTGAASGIGAAAARLLAEQGAFVHCADLNAAGAGAVAAELGPERAQAHRLDVSDEDDWAGVLAAIARAAPALGVVVHSAGISAASQLIETSLAEWRRVMAVNLDGAFLAVRSGITAMRESGGAIVLIGSASGIRPAAGAAAYSTSKAGLAMLARTAAKECRATGYPIRVNVVSPAGVKTALWRSMPFFQDLVARHGSEAAAFTALAGDGPPFAAPEEIARVVAFLASPAASQVTGVELAADAGYGL
jgi:2-keto-3-deoxy-L-fuconate dehydrogenase